MINEKIYTPVTKQCQSVPTSTYLVALPGFLSPQLSPHLSVMLPCNVKILI